MKAKDGELISSEDSDVLSLLLKDGNYYDEIQPRKPEDIDNKPFAKSYFDSYTINIDLSTFIGKELLIEVFDINGKVILSKNISNSYGNSYFLDLAKIKNTSSLFFIKLHSNLDEIRYGKLIIN